MNFWVLLYFVQKTLVGEVANVLTLVDIGLEWRQNQTFMLLNEYRPSFTLATKYDIINNVFPSKTCLVYITEMLVLNKSLTKPLTTPWPSTKLLLAISRFTLFTRDGKATSSLKFVWSVMPAQQESDKFFSTLNLNQNYTPARQTNCSNLGKQKLTPKVFKTCWRQNSTHRPICQKQMKKSEQYKLDVFDLNFQMYF